MLQFASRPMHNVVGNEPQVFLGFALGYRFCYRQPKRYLSSCPITPPNMFADIMVFAKAKQRLENFVKYHAF